MTFQMVHIEAIPRHLIVWGHSMEQKTNLMVQDEGYLVHSALRAAFGVAGPQPFEVFKQANGRLKILGYADGDSQELKDALETSCEPLLAEAFPQASLHSKLMPQSWPKGKYLRFRVHCCPIARVRRENGKVVEKDVFLLACDRNQGKKMDREQVYLDWLETKLAKDGAASLAEGLVKGFSLSTVNRRAGRQLKRLGPRPEVTIDGVLRIDKSQPFTQLLRRGIGRHCSFGFGALLLRPL